MHLLRSVMLEADAANSMAAFLKQLAVSDSLFTIYGKRVFWIEKSVM